MRLLFATVLSALLCAGAARAQDAATPPPQPARAQEPLSKEDAELVKQLALLERLDLVKNLELFEDKGEKGDTLSGDRPDDKVAK